MANGFEYIDSVVVSNSSSSSTVSWTFDNYTNTNYHVLQLDVVGRTTYVGVRAHVHFRYNGHNTGGRWFSLFEYGTGRSALGGTSMYVYNCIPGSGSSYGQDSAPFATSLFTTYWCRPGENDYRRPMLFDASCTVGTSGDSWGVRGGCGAWGFSDDIESMDITLEDGNWVDGSKFTLYGFRKA